MNQKEKSMHLLRARRARSLTRRGTQRGEDQQARNPRPERHPKLVSPPPSNNNNTERDASFLPTGSEPPANGRRRLKRRLPSSSVVFQWDRKWRGAAVTGDTHYLHISLSAHALFRHRWKQTCWRFGREALKSSARLGYRTLCCPLFLMCLFTVTRLLTKYGKTSKIYIYFLHFLFWFMEIF